MTRAGGVLLPHYLDLWPFDPKINEIRGLMAAHFCAKYGGPSCIGFWDTVRKSRHTDKWRPKNRTTAAIVGVGRPNKTGCVVDCSMNIWRVWTWWLQNKWTTVIIVENTASRSSWLSECTVDLCCTPVYVCRGRIDTCDAATSIHSVLYCVMPHAVYSAVLGPDLQKILRQTWEKLRIKCDLGKS